MQTAKNVWNYQKVPVILQGNLSVVVMKVNFTLRQVINGTPNFEA